MAASAAPIDEAAFEAAADAYFKKRDFDPKDLNLLAKKDQVSGLRGSVEQFKDITVREFEERTGKLEGTFDEKVRAALGPLAEQFAALEKQILEADKRGIPDSQRAFMAGGSMEYHRVFDAVGKLGVARTLHREDLSKDIPTEWGMTRAQLADTPTKGGVAIPTITAEEFMMVRASFGVGRAVFPTQSLGRAMAMIMPVVDVEPTPAKGVESTVTPQNVTDATLKAAVDSTTTAAMISGTVYLSFKIPPEVLAELTSLIGVLLLRRVGDVEDTWIFNNTDPWNGLLQTVTGAKVIEDQTASGGGDGTSFAHLSFKAINGVKFKPHPQSMGAGLYFMHPEHWETVTGLVDTTNRPLDIGQPQTIAPQLTPFSPLNAQQPHAQLRGRPVYFVPGMPGMADDAADTKFIVYADPMFGRIGISQDFQIKASEETKLDLLMRTIVGYESIAFRYFIPSGGAYIATAAGS